jgi:hypothetical protein
MSACCAIAPPHMPMETNAADASVANDRIFIASSKGRPGRQHADRSEEI